MFIRFLDIGIEELTNILGIDNRIFYKNIRALDLRSLEVARELNHFDKHKPPFIPVSRYGRDLKRDLGHVGFPNYYDYVDYSSSDDYGNGLPEYEI